MSLVTPHLVGRADRDFSTALDHVFSAEVVQLVEDAELRGAFPRQLIEMLGREGIFAAKWPEGVHPNVSRLISLAERLGGLGSAGIAVGVSLHDAAIAILRRFGRNMYLRDIATAAIAGETVLCIGASETGGGSDLQNVKSTNVAENGGYRLRGHKKYVSLSPIADIALIVVRGVATDGSGRHGDVALFAVPTEQLSIGDVYTKVGASCLDTAPLSFDTWVPPEAMIARPGTGLAAISWGLAHERLSVAGQVVGACDLAIGVTVARMKQREQFGVPLFDHQALRLRIADLHARVDVLRWALLGIATEGSQLNLRTSAAMKVTAARLGEEVISECMHIFGGTGYLPDQSPLGRWWRDMKLGRVGGGTDEVLWELVAATLRPDFANLQRFVHE
ncbi:acyl-CoA dehydrogenase family protein [Mycobacterium sp. URHB0021]